MKALLVGHPWIGGMIDALGKAFISQKFEVDFFFIDKNRNWLQKIKLNQFKYINRMINEKKELEFNRLLVEKINTFKPEIFFVLNEGHVHSSTIQLLKKKGVLTICYIVDNPFDSFRFSQLAISLKYFDKIFVADKVWIPSINNVVNNKNVRLLHVGYNSDMFFAEDDKFEKKNKKELSCDISFTGESYGLRAEGAYRSGILDYLIDYNVKIWGDKGWELAKPYHPIIEKAYQGGRLSYNDLRALYRISTINLNLPAPQILTAFQPRLFEIPACKGFQIVDWREDIDELFSEDEIVSFKSIPELLDKVNYFINNPEKRNIYINNIYHKVIENHKWENRVSEIMNELNISKN